MRTPQILVLDADEALSLQVIRATARMRPHPGVTWCDGFEAVDRLAGEDGPFDVLIAGPLVFKEAGFEQLRLVRARLPDMALVLATDRWRSGSLRDTVRTGALDILRLPVADDELVEAVEQAMETRQGSAPAPGTAGVAASPPVGVPHDGQGAVMVVTSATGGSGKTFFATNLAYHLQSRLGRSTCLIDLDLQFGELSTALRLKPKYTILDLVGHDPDEDLSGRLQEHLALHESGVHVLAAPDEPADADAIDVKDVTRVIEAARAGFDYVIIDTPTSLRDSVLVAVEQADRLFALATLDLPSVRNLGVLLTTLKKLQVPSERIQLLLNKVEPNVGIEIPRVERYFPQGFSMVVPYGREVNRSLNMGQPLLAYAPRGEVGKALDAGLSRTLAAGPGALPPAAAGRRSRLSLPGWRSKKPA
jgi:pilus assembly protein CpaE